MGPDVTEIFDTARSLTAVERADLAQRLLLTIDDDDSRLWALRAAIDTAVEGIESGGGVRIPAGGTRPFIQDLGEQAARLADASAK